MKRIVALTLLCFLALYLVCTVYVQKQTEISAITRLGDPIGKNTQPGVAFKGILDTRHVYDNRWYAWEGNPMDLPTLDRKLISVTSYGPFRIVDPMVFLNAVGSVEVCRSRLDAIFDGALNDLISRNMLIEVVRTNNRKMMVSSVDESDSVMVSVASGDSTMIRIGRDSLMTLVLREKASVIKSLGIEFKALNLKSIMYTPLNLQDAFNFQIGQQLKVAALYKSRGEGAAQEILGAMERDLKRIESEGYKTAMAKRAEGESISAAKFNQAYSQNPEFYKFWRRLQTLESVVDGTTTMWLSTDSKALQSLK